MIGAILGDIVGSPYEFHNIKKENFPLIQQKSRYTDDTVMTLAVVRSLMDGYGKTDEEIMEILITNMKKYGRMFPDAGYGGMFYKWLMTEETKPYNSFGNGSAMRVSSVGWLYPTMEETLHMAALTAGVTHNHPEGIKGAQAIAAAIYLARTGADKEEIMDYVRRNFMYNLDFTMDEIRPGYHFDVTCQGSVPQAIRAFYEGSDYESTLRKAVSIGGDSDTISCMAGGIAEAYYGMPEMLKEECLDILPKELRKIAEEFTKTQKALPLNHCKTRELKDSLCQSYGCR